MPAQRRFCPGQLLEQTKEKSSPASVHRRTCFIASTIGKVPRRIGKLVVTVIVLFATLTPLANCFDTWDKNPNPAKDTETHLAAWFAAAGFVLVMAELSHLKPPAARPGRGQRAAVSMGARQLPAESPGPAPTASPPLLPLRI